MDKSNSPNSEYQQFLRLAAKVSQKYSKMKEREEAQILDLGPIEKPKDPISSSQGVCTVTDPDLLKAIQSACKSVQIDYHECVYRNLTAELPEGVNFSRQHLIAGVGMGKTRITLSIMLRLFLETKIQRGIFIFVPCNEQFLIDELETFQCKLTGREVSYKVYCSQKIAENNEKTGNYADFVKEWNFEDSAQLMFVSAGILSQHDQLNSDWFSSFKKDVIVAVDESKNWEKRGSVGYLLMELWRPRYQLFISATTLAGGLEGVRLYVNGSLYHTGRYIGSITQKFWAENLAVVNVKEKSIFVQEAYYKQLLEIRAKLDIVRAGQPTTLRTFSCDKEVNIFAIYVQPSIEMQNEYTIYQQNVKLPNLQHQKQSAPFVSKVSAGDILLFFDESKAVENDTDSDGSNEDGDIDVNDLDCDEDDEGDENDKDDDIIDTDEETENGIKTLERNESMRAAEEDLNFCNKVNKILPALLTKLVTREERKVIIISKFSRRLNKLQKILIEKMPDISKNFHLIDGSSSLSSRKIKLKEFSKSNGKSNVLLMVLNLAIGLNLQSASAIIFLEPTWSYSSYEQGIGRIARFGQEKDVFVFTLIYSDTIETSIFETCCKAESLVHFFRHQTELPYEVQTSVSGELRDFRPSPIGLFDLLFAKADAKQIFGEEFSQIKVFLSDCYKYKSEY